MLQSFWYDFKHSSLPTIKQKSWQYITYKYYGNVNAVVWIYRLITSHQIWKKDNKYYLKLDTLKGIVFKILFMYFKGGNRHQYFYGTQIDFVCSYHQDYSSKNQCTELWSPYHQPKSEVQFVLCEVLVKNSNTIFLWLISKKWSACNWFLFSTVQLNSPLSLLCTNTIEDSGCVLGDFCYYYSNLITFMHNCSMASLSRKYFLPRPLALSFSCRRILIDVPKVPSCLFCFWLCLAM